MIREKKTLIEVGYLLRVWTQRLWKEVRYSIFSDISDRSTVVALSKKQFGRAQNLWNGLRSYHFIVHQSSSFTDWHGKVHNFARRDMSFDNQPIHSWKWNIQYNKVVCVLLIRSVSQRKDPGRTNSSLYCSGTGFEMTISCLSSHRIFFRLFFVSANRSRRATTSGCAFEQRWAIINADGQAWRNCVTPDFRFFNCPLDRRSLRLLFFLLLLLLLVLPVQVLRTQLERGSEFFPQNAFYLTK